MRTVVVEGCGRRIRRVLGVFCAFLLSFVSFVTIGTALDR